MEGIVRLPIVRVRSRFAEEMAVENRPREDDVGMRRPLDPRREKSLVDISARRCDRIGLSEESATERKTGGNPERCADMDIHDVPVIVGNP